MEITAARITLVHCPGYHSATLDLVSGRLTVSIRGNQSMWPSPDRVQFGAWSTEDSTRTVRLSYDDGHLQYGFYLESNLDDETDPGEHSVHIVYNRQHMDWLLPTLALLHRHCQGEEVEIPTPEGLPVTVEHRRFSGTPEVELDNYHHNQ